MEDVRNVIIIGSGPAGLTAALYCARADLKPLVLAGVKWGGQLMLTTDVENFPGFVNGIQGPDLMKNFREQAERFGADIKNADVTAVDFSPSTHSVNSGRASSGQAKTPFTVTGDGETYKSKSVIIATGAETNWLGLPNEQKLIGRGISSCAPCDAFFFRDKKVIVVGGGDSAMEEALFLTKFATDVTIVHRRDEFRASKIMADRAKANPKISFLLNTVVVDVLGGDKVIGVKIKNVKDDKETEMPIDGLFVAIGHSPMTNVFSGQVDLDERGYVKKVDFLKENFASGNPSTRSARSGPSDAYGMMTSVEGVFVAGDVHDLHYKQAVTAAGFGCQAALEAEKWLEAQG